MIYSMTSEKTYSLRTWSILLAVAILIIDQLSKIAVLNSFNYAEHLNVVPSFDLTLRFNTGAAFNFLANASGWQRWFFSGVAILMSLGIVVWLGFLKDKKKDRMEAFALGLILGGALGNLIDRVWYGYVVDFILLYYKEYSYPAFNIADAAICIGTFLFALDFLKKKS